MSLYYDVINGSQRTVTLIGKVLDAVTSIKDAWNAGGTPVVPASVSKYLSLETIDGKLEIVYNYNKWQEDVDMKGFCSIASSHDIGAAETNRIYHLRDTSETQYMIMKSHMGYDVTRTHYTEGVENKLAVCFVASILRTEIVNACKEHKLNTSRMLREIDRIELLLLPNNIYEAVHDETIRQKELLAEFDIISLDFNVIAKAYNQKRLTPISSQIHEKPSHDASSSKKKRGRPAGSKKGKSDATLKT